MEVVPWPDNIVVPVGATHLYDSVFAIGAILKVIVSFGQALFEMDDIVPGVCGSPAVTSTGVQVRALLPQILFAETQIFPDTETVPLTEMEFVP